LLSANLQLNIRKLLEDLRLPPINIICQKVATQGLTRFEDRRRLPLGISINFNSMAAKLLTQVCFMHISAASVVASVLLMVFVSAFMLAFVNSVLHAVLAPPAATNNCTAAASAAIRWL
jgi:hypothetical protein